MISRDKELYLIDYGCARKFRDQNGWKYENNNEIEGGNVHFASKNAFLEQTLSRRDDLIQAVCNIMVLYNDFLPLREKLGYYP